jgi:hypothetical protein
MWPMPLAAPAGLFDDASVLAQGRGDPGDELVGAVLPPKQRNLQAAAVGQVQREPAPAGELAVAVRLPEPGDRLPYLSGTRANSRSRSFAEPGEYADSP